MAFRRRSQSLRPVNRIKHVVDGQQAAAIGANAAFAIIQSVDAPVQANTAECVTGSTVNGIYIHAEAVATSAAALPNLYFYIWKNPGGNLTRPAFNQVGLNDNKRYVFHQSMVMFQRVVNSNPRVVFDGVIAIPKHLRRNGPEDVTEVIMGSPGITTELCLQAHYKEFR